MTRVDSPVPLMHHDLDRSWIIDPYPDHPKEMQPVSHHVSIGHIIVSNTLSDVKQQSIR